MASRDDQAKHFRNNSTLPEVLLWNRLKQDQIGFQFRRQDVQSGFILDFYCPELRVDVEVDGKVHKLKENRDAVRDAKLMSEGITVIRYSARSVLRDPEIVAFQIKTTKQRMQKSQNTSSDGEVGEERTG